MMYADSLHARTDGRMPLQRRGNDRHQHPPLAPLTVRLLQMASPHDDSAQFSALVADVYEHHADAVIAVRLKELLINGYITEHGSPRLGWLTRKGTGALARALALRSES
jgi:hypothetical protein